MIKKRSNPKLAFLFSLSIVTLCVGIIILFIGALSHINPNISFKNLWTREPLMNFIYTILPSIK